VEVLAYRDEASGTLELAPGGSGHFTDIELRPAVTIAAGSDPELAVALHDAAHQECFLAASCRVPVRCSPTVATADAPSAVG
jgi:organic hydroperoxide reductase OsmC/OhrA